MITYELTPDLKRLIDSGADGGNGEFEPFLPPKLAEIAGKSNISFMPQIVRSRAYGEDRVAWVQVNNESRDIVEKSIDQLTEQEPTSVVDLLYNDFSGEEVEAYLKRIEKARKVEGMTAPTKDPVEEAIDMVMKESITDITSFSDETKRKYWTKYRELTRRGIPHTRAQQEAYEYAVSN